MTVQLAVPFALNMFSPYGLESHLSWLNTLRSPLHREQLADGNAAMILSCPLYFKISLAVI